MEDHGATVVAIPDPQLADLRVRLGVPREALSCHTALIDGYVVEGHVPAAAVARLLADRPDAVGIAVPRMPEGAPGMGGDPATWASLDVFLIGHDGGLTPFGF